MKSRLALVAAICIIAIPTFASAGNMGHMMMKHKMMKHHMMMMHPMMSHKMMKHHMMMHKGMMMMHKPTM